ncbi:YgfZ/GcvT domain-containing protein [Bacteroidota bacterium]
MHDLDMKPTDLIEYLSSKGYDATAVDGYKVMNKYTSKEKEIESLYFGVGLRNISHYGIIELKGKDVLEFFHRITTNSTKNLPKAHTQTTLFTTDKGRIIGVGKLINFEDYQLMVCGRENKSRIMSWIRKYIITDDVQVRDANGKYNLLELLGPQADSFIRLICGNMVNEIEQNTFKIIHTDNILFFLIKRADERGNSKFWLLADLENCKRLIDTMISYDGPFDFNMVGEEAYNSYRIEQGYPAAPYELNDSFNPHEANLMQYVDTSKGCYIGQEVIERLETYEKVQKKLCGVEFNEELFGEQQFNLFDKDETEAGVVTSTVDSIKLDSPIGLAYIRKSFIKAGTKLTARSNNGRQITVTVKDLPFIK